jgi:hypothetical protein
MKLVELRDGVNVHTKINRSVKRTIETMNRTTGIDQNVIINSILTQGLASRLQATPSRTRRTRATSRARR